MKRTFKIVSIFILSLTLMAGSYTISYANPKEGSAKQMKKVLLTSELQDYKNSPAVQTLISELENKAVSNQFSSVYVKMATDISGNVTQTEYTSAQYEEEMQQITPMNLPIDKNFGWIRLKLEAYKTGSQDYQFVGFYEWLTKPFFTGNDAFTIGHDSTVTFDTASAFGQFNCTYYPDYVTPVENWQDYSASSVDNCETDVNGVGFKFKLQTVADSTPAYYKGLMSVNGSVLNSSGNLQISYGHSQLAFNYDVNDGINFLTTGQLDFKIIGSKDVATWGDRVVN